MYTDIAFTGKSKRYKRVLLRASYREGKKVKYKTMANLSSCSEDCSYSYCFKIKKTYQS